MARLHNRYLLTTMVIDLCHALKAPTLLEAIEVAKPTHLFRADLRLEACPEVYEAAHVRHRVKMDIDVGKPVEIA